MGTEEEDLFEFMMDKKEEINNILIQNTVRNSQKVQFCATVQLEKPFPDDDGLKIFVRSNTQPVYKEGLKDEEYLEMLEKMLGILYTFTASGNGWMAVKIVQLEIRVALFTPMTGSSYIALPHQLQAATHYWIYATMETTIVLCTVSLQRGIESMDQHSPHPGNTHASREPIPEHTRMLTLLLINQEVNLTCPWVLDKFHDLKKSKGAESTFFSK